MIELNEEYLKSFQRHSSKGNQLKWEKDGIWYKADYTGYEGLAEYIISQLLAKSSLPENEFVLYEPVQIKYKRSVLNGAESKNFLKSGWQIMTLERLYKNRYNRSFIQDVWNISDIKERLNFLVSQTEKLANIKDFGIYISKMMTIDAFFLNEDRHLHNVAVLVNEEGEFAFCPYFDHGAGMLSDTTLDYPLNGSNLDETLNMMKEVEAKTVCSDFDEALDAAETLYGRRLKFSFTSKDVDMLLDAADIYNDIQKERVRIILRQQMRKYQFLF